MPAHIYEPEMGRLSARRLSESDAARVYRHLDECELCLRRLIEAERRLLSTDATTESCSEHSLDPDAQLLSRAGRG